MNIPTIIELPDDPAFLKQYARASMMHAHLDNTLKMYIRSFRHLTIDEALEYVGYRGAKQLRKEVEQLAAERFGEGEALELVRSFMKRCADISERRNELLHSPIGRERDGTRFLMRVRGATEWTELTTPTVLQNLAEATYELVEEMNHQRLSGAIEAALRGNPSARM
jgi:hypothetical protein